VFRISKSLLFKTFPVCRPATFLDIRKLCRCALVNWLIDWLIEWLIALLIACLNDWSRLILWVVDRLVMNWSVVCLAGYLADTHTGVGLAVGRKFRSYTSSSAAPLLVCGTAHYAKCLDQVLHAVTDPQPSVTKSGTAGRSVGESLAALHRRLKPGTRPAMHDGLRTLIDASGHTLQTVTTSVLPAQLDAIAAHVRSLLWPLLTNCVVSDFSFQLDLCRQIRLDQRRIKSENESRIDLFR